MHSHSQNLDLEYDEIDMKTIEMHMINHIFIFSHFTTKTVCLLFRLLTRVNSVMR